jgi:hypothetical protein
MYSIYIYNIREKERVIEIFFSSGNGGLIWVVGIENIVGIVKISDYLKEYINRESFLNGYDGRRI